MAAEEARTAKNTKTSKNGLRIADTTDGNFHTFARQSNIALDELEKHLDEFRKIARKNKDWVIVRNKDVLHTSQAIDQEMEEKPAGKVDDEIDDWVIVA
ncbi:hypothetical protein MMC18_001921 [Xylographa bjoerkii]|nr:hypothetical protein [Xylographa bjoerkii]